MKIKNNHLKQIAVLVLSLSFISVSAEAEQKSHDDLREAFRACHEELGIAQPAPGQRPQAPDETAKNQIDACLKDKGFEVPKFGPRHGGREESSGGVR